MVLNIILGSLLLISIVSLFLMRRHIRKKYISRAIIVKKMEAIVPKRGLFEGTFTWSEMVIILP